MSTFCGKQEVYSVLSSKDSKWRRYDVFSPRLIKTHNKKQLKTRRNKYKHTKNINKEILLASYSCFHCLFAVLYLLGNFVKVIVSLLQEKKCFWWFYLKWNMLRPITIMLPLLEWTKFWPYSGVCIQVMFFF